MYMFTWLFLVWIAPPLKSTPRQNFHFFFLLLLLIFFWGEGGGEERNQLKIHQETRLDCSRLSDGEDCPNKKCYGSAASRPLVFLFPLNDPLEKANRRPRGQLEGGGRGCGGGGGAKGTFLRLATGGTTKQFDVDIINLQRIIKIRNFKVVNKREWYYQMLQERCLSQGDQPCLHWFFLLQEQTIILLLVTLIEWYNYQNQPTKHKYYSQESTNSHFLLTLNSLTL